MTRARGGRSLRLAGISHAFGDHRVLSDISLTVAAGEIVCLLGPSGCGKTTLLRIAAGLEPLQVGSVSLGDDVVADQRRQVPPEQRDVGLMFQDFALFPHLTVRENVAFGLSDLIADRAAARVEEVLARVKMSAYAGHYPHTLSGGEQQRVALARALAPRPEVMLLDEPFSGLDQNMRVRIREDTLTVLRDSGTATLMVTHHPEEAMFMADRMMVMAPGGRIVQAGDPAEVYARPADSFVASFFGRVNRLAGTVENGVVQTPLGPVDAPGLAEAAKAQVIIRPDGLVLSPDASAGVRAEILWARSIGHGSIVRIRLAEGGNGLAEYTCRVPGAFAAGPDRRVGVAIAPAAAFVFAADESSEADDS